MSWDFVKVFQHWCEYEGCKPTLTLFFHIFQVQNGYKSTYYFGIISLQQYVKYFEPYYDSVKTFKDHSFLGVPLTQESRLKICNLNMKDNSYYTNIIHNYWTQ